MRELIVYHDRERKGWVVRTQESQRLCALVPDRETALELALLNAKRRCPSTVHLYDDSHVTTPPLLK